MTSQLNQAQDATVDDESSHDGLDRHARPHLGRSLLALATSVVPFLALWVAMYLALDVSYLLTLVLAVPTAGFLVRTYIMFHDCAHGSLMPGRRSNAYVGSALALLVATPFARWRYEHTMHHATAGDLDRRGVGDVPTITLAEYDAMSRGGRFGYRLFRNPLVMFGLGPIWGMLIEPRIAKPSMRPRVKRSVWVTNLSLLLLVGGLCWWLGWQEFLMVEGPLVLLAGGAGIWLFYVQHQFDDTYWKRTEDWTFADAALHGSSYLRLPKVLQFFSGSIGLHHVHHLNPKIPNYRLQGAHDQNEIFHAVPRQTFWKGLRATRLKVWDERGQRLVTWAERRRSRAPLAKVSG